MPLSLCALLAAETLSCTSYVPQKHTENQLRACYPGLTMYYGDVTVLDADPKMLRDCFEKMAGTR